MSLLGLGVSGLLVLQKTTFCFCTDRNFSLIHYSLHRKTCCKQIFTVADSIDLQERDLLGRPSGRWEDNIRMDLEEIGINVKNWVDLAQDRDYC